MCEAGETVCNGATCADTMTDELNCGACNAQCAPTQACKAGTCTPITSCADVREISETDGIYTTPTNVTFYCDFANNVQYSAFGLGAHNATYTDYQLISSADLNQPGFQGAFVALWNRQGGLLNLAPGLSPGNCCLKSSDAGAGQMLVFNNNQYIYPAQAATNISVCGGPYNDTRYRIFLNVSGEYPPIPLSMSFFATHTASVAAFCSDGANPGIFARKVPIN